MSSPSSPLAFASSRHVVLVADLTGYHRGFRSHSDSEMAAFLHEFYVLCESVVTEHGGRVVKFIGDAVLAVFPSDAAPAAVRAALVLSRGSSELAASAGLDSELGANVHMGDLVATEIGDGASRAFDVVDRVVNQTFLLGNGEGVRLSERVYRALPSSERSPWEKRKPPTVYTLG